jgi:hypothetical protein
MRRYAKSIPMAARKGPNEPLGSSFHKVETSGDVAWNAEDLTASS